MKILLTGGLGHIGSKFIEDSDSSYEITVIDDLSSQRFCSLFNLNRKIKFYEKSIHEITVDDLRNYETVIHFAAITNAAGSFNNKNEVELINLNYTNQFIDRCEEAGCNFIFPSSTSVYGVSKEIVDESNDDYLNPQSPYADTKIQIEKRLREYKGKYLILRFGTIFGKSKGMRFHTAINKFCYEASLGNPLTIWQDNFDQYRPYLGINDAIKAINFCLDNSIWNDTFNILTGNYKLSEIVSLIESIKPVKLNMVKTPLLNQYSYHVSDDKIRNKGFIPLDNLEEEIRGTLHLLSGVLNE